MTTNVHDVVSRQLAVDSRWSVDLRGHTSQKILFVDDADYQKIVRLENHAVMFAGSSKKIDQWKLGLVIASMNRNYALEALPTKGVAVLLIDLENGRVVAKLNHSEIPGEASFAGTGSKFAKSIWPTLRDARMTVEAAKSNDPFSGGTVRTLDYGTGQHNLGTDGPYSKFHDAFMTKGMVMFLDGPRTLPVAEAAAEDDSLHDVLNALQAGRVDAQAPFDSMETDISPEEKEAFFADLRKAFRLPAP